MEINFAPHAKPDAKSTSPSVWNWVLAQCEICFSFSVKPISPSMWNRFLTQCETYFSFSVKSISHSMWNLFLLQREIDFSLNVKPTSPSAWNRFLTQCETYFSFNVKSTSSAWNRFPTHCEALREINFSSVKLICQSMRSISCIKISADQTIDWTKYCIALTVSQLTKSYKALFLIDIAIVLKRSKMCWFSTFSVGQNRTGLLTLSLHPPPSTWAIKI
jgi:hypothetical protein